MTGPATAERPDDERLAEAEAWARGLARVNVRRLAVLLAEYDRRGAELVRVPSDMAVLRAERDRCASQAERLRHSHRLVVTEMEQACANVDRLQREAIARDAELERLEAQRAAVLALCKQRFREAERDVRHADGVRWERAAATRALAREVCEALEVQIDG